MSCHPGTRQCAGLVDKWVTLVELDPAACGTHALRRTKVALLTERRAIFGPANSCWATQSSRVPSDISLWRSMTPSNCPRRWSC